MVISGELGLSRPILPFSDSPSSPRHWPRRITAWPLRSHESEKCSGTALHSPARERRRNCSRRRGGCAGRSRHAAAATPPAGARTRRARASRARRSLPRPGRAHRAERSRVAVLAPESCFTKPSQSPGDGPRGGLGSLRRTKGQHLGGQDVCHLPLCRPPEKATQHPGLPPETAAAHDPLSSGSAALGDVAGSAARRRPLAGAGARICRTRFPKVLGLWNSGPWFCTRALRRLWP
jgi:hypothetical protein